MKKNKFIDLITNKENSKNDNNKTKKYYKIALVKSERKSIGSILKQA